MAVTIASLCCAILYLTPSQQLLYRSAVLYDSTVLRAWFTTAHGLLKPNPPTRRKQKVDEDYKSKHCYSPTRIVVHEILDIQKIACFQNNNFDVCT